MKSIQKSLRIPTDTLKIIEQISNASGMAFNAVVKDLLSEAIKMRRCPGIIFTEGINGRRARIAGTGLEVWEVITSYQGVDQDFDRLQKAYHWLTIQQLKAALGYYSAYHQEIENLISQNQSLSKESVYKLYPFLKPQEKKGDA